MSGRALASGGERSLYFRQVWQVGICVRPQLQESLILDTSAGPVTVIVQ
jgi:hypothetical protein